MRDGDYVLGTDAEEIERLGLQHCVWRSAALDAWNRAGISSGQTVLDVGAGPGHAALDLAGIVGKGGQVIAIERSPRFLAALKQRSEHLGHGNIQCVDADVATESFGREIADAAWCRWVLSFVSDTAAAVCNIAEALKPGGYAVFHEYGNYGSWRLMPPNAELERFRELVVRSWRDTGGEPDTALRLPPILSSAGLKIISMKPLVQIVRSLDSGWRWPASFMRSGAARLHQLGYIGAEEAERLGRLLIEAGDDGWMMTPLVVEVIARRVRA